ncbi:MAG TPA: hypothetical protein VKZ53_26195 [Candidatus Angelobacter sp.]|nr:hypothetical protein [Candidatus Angelobacter sp.]
MQALELSINPGQRAAISTKLILNQETLKQLTGVANGPEVTFLTFPCPGSFVCPTVLHCTR